MQVTSLRIPNGTCPMVVCYFETNCKDALAYALQCDTAALRVWDAEARRELSADGFEALTDAGSGDTITA